MCAQALVTLLVVYGHTVLRPCICGVVKTYSGLWNLQDFFLVLLLPCYCPKWHLGEWVLALPLAIIHVMSAGHFFPLTLFISEVLKNATGSLSSVWLKNRPCCTALWRYSLKSSLRFSGRVVAEEVLQLFPFWQLPWWWEPSGMGIWNRWLVASLEAAEL